ncbi:hypothetical protein IU367_07775 [Aeromonas bestiarum]|uniref:hypothetical protein n=1 Tax=Aeromonas bestiarum TaxID=105751 RepID=UPI002377F1A7|nr:hypothetical protein [Aeromonas bestiarum]WDL84063.1 hypothetical protein IU367_07775 [Aeromonas bestiarum]
MTQKPNQTTQSRLNLLTQLEYCRLGRAAEILGCEVSDLIHFGATERVELYLLLTNEPVVEVHFPELTDDFLNRFNQRKNKKFILGLNTAIRPVGSDELEYSSRSQRAMLYGLWQLPPNIISFFEDDMSMGLEDIYVRVMAKTSEGDIAFADLKEWERPPTVKDFYLKQADLIRLHTSFTTGSPLERQVGLSVEQVEQIQQANELIQRKPSHQAERYAANRELILAAAIHAKLRWPDECGNTAKEWADTILDHALQLFPDRPANDPAPLSDQVIERILGAAMNNGTPHKSK